ncbi:MAG: biotin--[acetyl-CoA-carboxylase] ligase [Geminicoccaceae bacterium]|nr:biotin--[acetyl-CoA-carboxylase] ligase [Geminicoccaceae bacterium]
MTEVGLWNPRVEIHEEVASTNDLARAAALRGEPAGLWVLARSQTAGRGRLGRSWRSPPGNFYGSLLLRPARPLAECATLSLLAALAVAEAVDELAEKPLRAAVKWPNDVLLGRAKLAGVLPEALAGPGGSCAALVLGIGVNLVSHPEDLGRPAISLRAAGVPAPAPEAFLSLLDRRLRMWLGRWEREGFAALRAFWLARAAGMGERVRLAIGDRVHEGRLVDVDTAGAVLLETATGARLRFGAGELFLEDATVSSSGPSVPL